MRIHSDILTRKDIYAALPGNVQANCEEKGSRKRARAFEVTLCVLEKDSLHRRLGNSGGYGASSDVAATWDEWGVWLAGLFDLDPQMWSPYYADREDFYARTEEARAYATRYHKPDSLEVRTHTAPWLEKVPA